MEKKLESLKVTKVQKTQIEAKGGFIIKHTTVFEDKENGIKVTIVTKGIDGAVGYAKDENVNINLSSSQTKLL